MTVSRFGVKNMDCAADEQLIRMHLSQLDGIEKVTIDLDTRHVAVRHHTQTSAITSAIETLSLGSTHLEDLDAFGDFDGMNTDVEPGRERRALLFALVINALFFVGELTMGLVSGSMGLVADSLDMGADAAVYTLSLLAVGTVTARKNQLARTSGYLQLTLACVGLVEVIRRFVTDDGLPDVAPMIVVSLLALAGNIASLVVLRRVRSQDAHFQASWIFTANDIKVNALVIAAAIGVAITNSAIPDLAAGAIIFVVVANGARRILRLAS